MPGRICAASESAQSKIERLVRQGAKAVALWLAKGLTMKTPSGRCKLHCSQVNFPVIT
jgi:hypothetical protein